MRRVGLLGAGAGALVVAMACGESDGGGGPPVAGSGGTNTGGAAGAGAVGVGGSSGAGAFAGTGGIPPADAGTCPNVTVPNVDSAKIELSPGKDAYSVALGWSGGIPGTQVFAEAASDAAGTSFQTVMAPMDVSLSAGTAAVDKTTPDIFLRLVATVDGNCRVEGPVVRLAKPDYADAATWQNGWIRVVSHTHSIADVKSDVGGPVYANRINWFNGCFQTLGNDAACHELLLRSFSESGLEWLMAAAKDHGIGAVIVTDHDNVGLWYTDTFRKYDKADPSGPSVIHGMEWTSALGHLTVVGNFLPQIAKTAKITDLATAKQVHSATPLPPDSCDDTDENHKVNSPAFDGPDAPCKRADHRGHGDDPPTVAEAKASIQKLKAAGALVYINHPTQNALIEPPMKWQLDNLDLVDGAEVNTPDPTLTNMNAPEWWRDQGLQAGRRWVGIAGTDCHVNGTPYTGSTGCSSFHGLIDLTHMDAPYMWVKPLTSTSAAANNAPNLVVAALREGRVTVVQDIDPAVVADVTIDANGDGSYDYWGGSVLPACEQPSRTSFDVKVLVKPVQTHNYNVSVWRNGVETKLLQDTKLNAGQVWSGTTSIDRVGDVPAGAKLGYVMVQVRENKTLAPDNDAGFVNPIFFEPAKSNAVACDTRKADGS
ncbi:MAG: hypothetical protein R3B13_36435 [Polyangiaceae bacterium]